MEREQAWRTPRTIDTAAIDTPLGKDVLLLESFSGTEGVSELFRFDVRLLADVTRTIDFDAIVGKTVTVRVFTPTGERFFNGLVSRFSEGRSDSRRSRPTTPRSCRGSGS